MICGPLDSQHQWLSAQEQNFLSLFHSCISPYRLDGQTVKARASCVRGFKSPAKSYTALQTVCHRFIIYAGSYVALTL